MKFDVGKQPEKIDVAWFDKPSVTTVIVDDGKPPLVLTEDEVKAMRERMEALMRKAFGG